MSSENQLHLASKMHADIGNYYTQNMVCRALAPLQAWHGTRNKALRSAGAAVARELDMMSGAAWTHVRSAMQSLADRQYFDDMGIEVSWRKCDDVVLNGARVTASDTHASQLWDGVFALARASAQRLLPLTVGFPR
eukprot:2473715-Pyramimonas_sp.AAC.1